MQKLWDKKALFLHRILDGQVRLVGGCVRDFLLHKRFTDRDMATPLTPDEVVARLTKNGIPYLEIGRAFGTIVAKVDETPFEITTLRKDIETDGRHAVVGFTKSWAVDAKRRDFTINALYADAHGKIYDYVGGLEDLKQGRVRFVGPALRRMHEDYLRLLRYFRAHHSGSEPTHQIYANNPDTASKPPHRFVFRRCAFRQASTTHCQAKNCALHDARN